MGLKDLLKSAQGAGTSNSGSSAPKTQTTQKKSGLGGLLSQSQKVEAPVVTPDPVQAPIKATIPFVPDPTISKPTTPGLKLTADPSKVKNMMPNIPPAKTDTPMTSNKPMNPVLKKILETGKELGSFVSAKYKSINEKGRESEFFLSQITKKGEAKYITDPVTGKRTVTSPLLERYNAATPEEKNKIIEESEKDIPLVKALNSETGKKVTGFIAKNTANLPLKGLARVQALGDKTYEEARDALLEKAKDPNNNKIEKILYGVQDSGAQSGLAILLGLGLSYASKGKIRPDVITIPYFAAISAEGERDEKGEVSKSSLGNIAIDTIGDNALSGVAEAALKGIVKEGGETVVKSFLKETGKGFVTEGGTEVTQTILKAANDYSSANTEEDRQKAVQKITAYIKEGQFVDEFLIGGLSGGIIAGGASAAGQVVNPNIQTEENDREIVEQNVAEAAKRLARGSTENEVIFELSQTVPTDQAREIVAEAREHIEDVQKLDAADEDSASDTNVATTDAPFVIDDSVLQKRPADFQESFEKLDSKYQEEVKPLREKMIELEAKLESAPAQSQQKKDIKKSLSDIRTQLRASLTTRENDTISTVKSFNDTISSHIKNNVETRLTDEQVSEIATEIRDQILNPDKIKVNGLKTLDALTAEITAEYIKDHPGVTSQKAQKDSIDALKDEDLEFLGDLDRQDYEANLKQKLEKVPKPKPGEITVIKSGDGEWADTDIYAALNRGTNQNTYVYNVPKSAVSLPESAKAARGERIIAEEYRKPPTEKTKEVARETPKKPKGTLVSVNNEDFVLTGESEKRYNEAKESSDGYVKGLRTRNDEFSQGRIKAEGMKMAALKRELTGKYTPTEINNKLKYERSNYDGKKIDVEVNGEIVEGTITGKPSFGKFKVTLADGTVVSKTADLIKDPRTEKEIMEQILARPEASLYKPEQEKPEPKPEKKEEKPLAKPVTQEKSEKVSTPETREKAIDAPVETEGKKFKSKAFERVRDRLDLEESENYNRLNLAKDTAKAIDFVEANPEAARRIALGIELPPEGYTDTGISIAYAEKMKNEGKESYWADAERARSLRQTRRGQEIVAERGRFSENSPEHFIRQVLKNRLDNIGKDPSIFAMGSNKKTKKQSAIDTIDQEKGELKKKLRDKKMKLKEAQDLLDVLTCK